MARIKMSRIEETMRLALAFAEAFNEQDAARMVRSMSDDCRFESSEPAPDGAIYTGKEAIQQYWQQFFQAYPQARIDVEEAFGLGKRCVIRWRREWDASGKKQHVRGVDIFRVKQGALCEHFSYVKGSGSAFGTEG